MSENKKLEAWLLSELCKERPEGQGIRKFELRSAPPGSKGTSIESWPHEVRLAAEEIPGRALDIMQRAQEDADGQGPGVYRYVVLVHVKGEAKPSGRFPFRVRGDEDLDLDEGDSENAPTNKGLMMQLMRHNEALARTMTTSAASMANLMSRTMENMGRNIENLLDERMEMYKTLEAAKSDEHNRNMELMLTDGEQKRKDKAFEKIMTLVPLVVNKMIGAKLLPDKSDPLMMLLEPLITSMNAEQFQAIQSTLNPEQTMMFIELLQAFQKRQENSASKTKEN